jgi:hypothetical protein
LYEQNWNSEIDRSEYADAVEENNKRYQENPQLYRTRQENIFFGTIKDNGVTTIQFNRLGKSQ